MAHNILDLFPRPTSRGVFCITAAAVILTGAGLWLDKSLDSIERATEPVRNPIGNWIGQQFFELGQHAQPVIERGHDVGVVGLCLVGLGTAIAIRNRLVEHQQADAEQPSESFVIPSFNDYTDPAIRKWGRLADQVAQKIDGGDPITVEPVRSEPVPQPQPTPAE